MMAEGRGLKQENGDENKKEVERSWVRIDVSTLQAECLPLLIIQ
jgi:hypothetical protein